MDSGQLTHCIDTIVVYLTIYVTKITTPRERGRECVLREDVTFRETELTAHYAVEFRGGGFVVQVNLFLAVPVNVEVTETHAVNHCCGGERGGAGMLGETGIYV